MPRMRVEQFDSGLMAANTFVVFCEHTRQGMVVDPSGDIRDVEGCVQQHGLDIAYVVYTHAHPDHISCAAEVCRKTGARIAGHALARRYIRALPMRVLSGFGLFFKPAAPDMLLNEGDLLNVGRLKFQVFCTPGHSRDSICLAGGGAVFSGDVIVAGSVGRTDLPGGSHEQLLRSIREKILSLPDETIIYPGHGPATTVGQERRINPFIEGI